MTRDGINTSFWQSAESLDLSSDFIDLTFGTIIVGAGITGVTADEPCYLHNNVTPMAVNAGRLP
ncbi:hypothetical protein [Sphingobacterium sp.]|uniref:hypothetical protein n=1 Tax=Sphingobacterium sp. TaxID=341027 RepID=UPI0028AC2D7B|nr:hypothetical protein [Sphingobacterium sp.]